MVAAAVLAVGEVAPMAVMPTALLLGAQRGGGKEEGAAEEALLSVLVCAVRTPRAV